MILIDFSHLAHRNLYIAISQAKPSKIDGQYNTKEYINFFYHLMLNSLRYIQRQFSEKYGEIILAIDDRNYWRRDIYPDYKAHRKKDRDKSEINFEEFFDYLNEFIEYLDNYFPYKVIKVNRAEADDIIGVLAQEYENVEPILVVTSDKDLKQVLQWNVELYDPIQQRFIKMDNEELKRFILLHILLGDNSDNIGNIMYGTEFTPNFKKYLRGNDIYIDDPYRFYKMSISEKLINDYNIYKKNRKGEELPEKDIYKIPRFGEKTALKFMENLEENLKKNPILMENFKRNKKLILLTEIPQEIRDNIIKTYKEKDIQFDPNKIIKFIMKHNLQQQMMNISDFYIIPQKKAGLN